MPGSVEVSVAPPCSVPGGCGVEPSAGISAPRVVRNSPGQLQNVAPAFNHVPCPVIEGDSMSKLWSPMGNRVWEGSREEEVSELNLEACLGFNH